MLEAPEVEAHRHRTGHSKLDLILGALAIFLSCVSVFIAVRHGQTMEKLVAANTWPNLTYSTSNEAPDGTARISFDITNTGVGPARIESFEVFYKDTPMASLEQLHFACCSPDHKARANYSQSTVLDNVLPARESISFFTLRREQNTAPVWDLLDKERHNVRVRACYCSVFDECWVLDSTKRRPERVDQCTPSQPIEFTQ